MLHIACFFHHIKNIRDYCRRKEILSDVTPEQSIRHMGIGHYYGRRNWREKKEVEERQSCLSLLSSESLSCVLNPEEDICLVAVPPALRCWYSEVKPLWSIDFEGKHYRNIIPVSGDVDNHSCASSLRHCLSLHKLMHHKHIGMCICSGHPGSVLCMLPFWEVSKETGTVSLCSGFRNLLFEFLEAEIVPNTPCPQADSMGLWKAGPAWVTSSPSMTRWPV